jgi:hypothetical protein
MNKDFHYNIAGVTMSSDNNRKEWTTVGVNDTGSYDVQKYAHNIPPKTETKLQDVIGTSEMSEEDGCNLLNDADDE